MGGSVAEWLACGLRRRRPGFKTQPRRCRVTVLGKLFTPIRTTVGFMTHVTGRLTAKNRDQLRNTTLRNPVWATFTFSYRSVQFRLHAANKTLTELKAMEPMDCATNGEISFTVQIQYLHAASARRRMLKLFQLNASGKITGSNCQAKGRC